MTPTARPQEGRRSASASKPLPLPGVGASKLRSEEHTSELQSQSNLVCRLLLEKKKIEHFGDWIGEERRVPLLHHGRDHLAWARLQRRPVFEGIWTDVAQVQHLLYTRGRPVRDS